jgi:hypothetical protein
MKKYIQIISIRDNKKYKMEKVAENSYQIKGKKHFYSMEYLVSLNNAGLVIIK